MMICMGAGRRLESKFISLRNELNSGGPNVVNKCTCLEMIVTSKLEAEAPSSVEKLSRGVGTYNGHELTSVGFLGGIEMQHLDFRDANAMK